MKKVALFLTALLVATMSFAGTATLTKGQRSAVTTSRAKSSNDISYNNNINTIYGGQDLSPRHELVSTTVFA